MQSITKTYLIDIISRAVNKTIWARRASQNPSCYVHCAAVNEQEVNDFIQSIPYFDEKLKAFLLDKNDNATIISQSWETTFIIKSKSWAESNIWLQANPLLTIGWQAGSIRPDSQFLTLPY